MAGAEDQTGSMVVEAEGVGVEEDAAEERLEVDHTHIMVDIIASRVCLLSSNLMLWWY